MKKTGLTLAMAGLVAACGGSDNTTSTATPPTQSPASYSLAVRPHLGSMIPGGSISLQPLADRDPPLLAQIPASGDPRFEIPEDRCGPGLVMVAGAPENQYYSEATGKIEVLPKTEKIRALIPDICGGSAPVPVSILDEMVLHMPGWSDASTTAFTEMMTEFQKLAAERKFATRDYRDKLDAQIALMTEQARKMREASDQQLLAALGVGGIMKNGVIGTLPTEIGQPNTTLPSDPSGLAAAMIEAVMKQYGKVSGAAISPDANLMELLASMLAQSLAAQGAAVQQATAAAQLNVVLPPASPAKFDFASAADDVRGRTILGARGTALAQDVAGMLDTMTQRMSGFEEARNALAAAQAQAQAQQPVASPDLTLTLRTALTPVLLRAESPDRLRKAAAAGGASFACTAGGITRGTVGISYNDADGSGTLTAGDTFQARYDNCVVAEPISGVTLTRNGVMNLTYDPRSDTDIRLRASFEMLFGSGESDASGTPQYAYGAHGSWSDRAAFGWPGDILPGQLGSRLPAMLVEDVAVTIESAGSVASVQMQTARLDMIGQIADGGAGRAEFRSGGMAGGTFYGSTLPMIFDRGSDLRLTMGDFWFNRQAEIGGQLTAASDGRIKTTFTPFGSTTETTRTLPWATIVATYLAPAAQPR
ncbi:hypothetical protein [Cupriavidus sp. D384]|uniref:hypothetical protein n=1 Tax=Cupriavidus sp. D384 TaxID=1538095 RepID=UPI00082F9F57|nr:hypothetical protein [Cupriavidus sp. D384]